MNGEVCREDGQALSAGAQSSFWVAWDGWKHGGLWFCRCSILVSPLADGSRSLVSPRAVVVSLQAFVSHPSLSPSR